jgi:hypothetical protein
VCCTVLGCNAAGAGRGEQAAQLLGRADQLHMEAGVPVPPFLHDDLAWARETTETRLGVDAFRAEFERGRLGRLGDELAFSA